MGGSGLPFKQKGKLACLSRRNRSGEGGCMQNARFSKPDFRPLEPGASSIKNKPNFFIKNKPVLSI
jgi:hypothetical protein